MKRDTKNQDEIKYFNEIKEFLGDLDDDDYAWEIIDQIVNEKGIRTFEEFEERYEGRSKSPIEFIKEEYEKDVNEMPEAIQLNIDWEGVWVHESQYFIVIEMFDDYLFFSCPQ